MKVARALAFVESGKIVVAPDYGMKYLPRGVALGKLQAMVRGAEIMRREVGAA